MKKYNILIRIEHVAFTWFQIIRKTIVKLRTIM